MRVANPTPTQLAWLQTAVERAESTGEVLHIGYDPLDQSMKWKLGNGVWSPPVRTEER